ncbi:hypothetical protein ACTGV8_11240, partial [Streptococcus suis]
MVELNTGYGLGQKINENWTLASSFCFLFCLCRLTPFISYIMLKITFPDGAVRDYQAGVTTFEIAE